MLALTILLSAAAGVNAILGGEVLAVQLEGSEYICADDCLHAGVYYAQRGHFCPENEIIRQEDANGKIRKSFPFDCRGAELPKGFVPAPLKDGDEPRPRKCNPFKADANQVRDACVSSKGVVGDEKINKILQLSEVTELLKSATANTTDKNKPAPPKSLRECQGLGQQKFIDCRKKKRLRGV